METVDTIRKSFTAIIGLPAKNVELGFGTFITMDFGKEMVGKVDTNKGIIEQRRGEWHLWVYLCAWRIDQAGKPLAGSDDSEERIVTALKMLESKKFVSVEVLSSSYDLKLQFEQAYCLWLFARNTEDSEQWKLLTPEKKVLIAGPATELKIEDSGEL